MEVGGFSGGWVGRCNISWRGFCRGGRLGEVGGRVRCDIGRRCCSWRVVGAVVGVGVVVVTVVWVVVEVVAVAFVVGVVFVVVVLVFLAAAVAEPSEPHPYRTGLAAGGVVAGTWIEVVVAVVITVAVCIVCVVTRAAVAVVGVVFFISFLGRRREGGGERW